LMKERQTHGHVFPVKEVFSDLTRTSFQRVVYQSEGGEFRNAVAVHAARVNPDSGHIRVQSPLWPAQHIRTLRMPGPAVQNRMLGTWSIRVEQSSPQKTVGGTGDGTEVWWPGPGGYSVIEESYQNDANGDLEAFSPAWWGATAGGQKFVWYSSTEASGCVLLKNVAKWEGNRNVYTEQSDEGGKRVISREIFEDISESSFTQVMQKGPSAAELRTVRTMRARKVSSWYRIYDWEKMAPFTPTRPPAGILRRLRLRRGLDDSKPNWTPSRRDTSPITPTVCWSAMPQFQASLYRSRLRAVNRK